MGCADHLGEVWRESCVRGSTPGHCKGFVAKRRCSSAAVAEGAASTGESGRRYSAEACKRTGAARKSSYKQDAVDTRGARHSWPFEARFCAQAAEGGLKCWH